MIYFRDDDVLVTSRSWPNQELGRFRQVHDWVQDLRDAIHMPTVLVKDIQQFPTCIEFIKRETAAGRMQPEIHGWTHHDYGKLGEAQVYQEISGAKDWITTTFGRVPKFWATPWCAKQPHLYEVARKLDLILLTDDFLKLKGEGGVVHRLRKGMPISALHGHYLMFHWWEGGSRVARIAACIRHGSWDAAKVAEPGLFKE